MTNIHVVIDRSGSMSAIKSDAIGGFNEFLKGMRGKGNQRWWVWLFDSQGIDLIQDGVRAAKVEELTDETFVPRGGTPLYDAVGMAMAKAQEVAAEKNVIVVLTDGQENSSREWTSEKVKAAITKSEEDGWQLVFIAAGQDAWAETGMWIGAANAYVVRAAAGGKATGAAYGAATGAVASFHGGGRVMSGLSSVKEDGTVEEIAPFEEASKDGGI